MKMNNVHEDVEARNEDRFGIVRISKQKHPNGERLKINGQGIAFFQPQILESAEFFEEIDTDNMCTRYWINLFTDPKVMVEIILVSSENLDYLADKNTGSAKVSFCQITSEADLAASYKEISMYFRGSHTLKASDYSELRKNSSNSQFITLDRGGLAVVGSDLVGFQRYLLCLGLAVAYEHKLSSFLLKMSESERDKQIETYESLCEFLLHNYSRFPIKMQSHEVSRVWGMISEHYQLEGKREEVQLQMGNMNNLIQSKSARLSDRRASITNFCLGVIAILITVFSIAELPIWWSNFF